MTLRIPSLLILFISVCSYAQNERKLYEINVNDFNTLQVDNTFNVHYKCNPDSAGIVRFEATPDQADEVYFDNNRRGRLVIRRDPSGQGDTPPSLTVYSSSLKKIVNCGDSLVCIDSYESPEKFQALLIGNGRLVIHNLTAPEVDASIRSGKGQLIVDGHCTRASLSLTGTGMIQADNLDSVECKASIVGTGAITCNPTERLTVQGMGTGTVYYRNEPATLKTRGIGIKHALLDK